MYIYVYAWGCVLGLSSSPGMDFQMKFVAPREGLKLFVDAAVCARGVMFSLKF